MTMMAKSMILDRLYNCQKINSTDELLTGQQTYRRNILQENNEGNKELREGLYHEIRTEDEFKQLLHYSASSLQSHFTRGNKKNDNEYSSHQKHKTINYDSLLRDEINDKETRELCNDSHIKEIQAELEGINTQSAMSVSRRARTPKYGKDAYTQPDEILRTRILNRFDAIFDSKNKKIPFQIYTNTAAETSEDLQSKDVVQSKTLFEQQKNEETHVAQILKNRLTWSAPNRHDKHSTRPVSSTSIQNQHFQRTQFQHGLTASYSDLVRLSTAQQRQTSVTSVTAPMDDYNNRFKYMTCKLQRNLKRPRTAPSSYELKHKSIPAPRQQLAGFIAEVQSRRACTRSLLKKSGQLQHMVKMLARPGMSEDSFSD